MEVYNNIEYSRENYMKQSFHILIFVNSSRKHSTGENKTIFSEQDF